ncbi:MAG: YggS family pyridoxal phosphate-dependent enzyme [Candidatus Cloacimonetes bacterium]|nr:YggS family pyridoxal phosphate-dependent enzyme [Candidatus Cloacimonadota bacterium]MBS3767060.1 YggS family pyridoxal phosphate-dependent enzyme [Candidatus Cloacimonadota bacterium]
MTNIKKNVKEILDEIPDEVKLVAAAKTRTADEIMAAIEAGVEIIGENYVQESLDVYQLVGDKAEWHFIGHLQRNKVKEVVPIYEMIESLDSKRLARKINKEAKKINKVQKVLIEINSGEEEQKFGILPEDAIEFTKYVSNFGNLKVLGLMTMGPRFGEPEKSRPYFQKTKKIFDQLNGMGIDNIEMKYLSMGMTNSYKIALEEGANIIRIGTKIFGKREK